MQGYQYRRLSGFVTALVWLMTSAVGSLAQTNSIAHSPAKGVRLDATSFESVAGLVDWKEEPVWGKVIVINGFTVPDDFRQWEIVTKLEVLVPVEFRVLGVMYMNSAGFVPEQGTERLMVRLKVQGARWKIMEPIVPPHVGQKRMLNYVREALLQEKDGARQVALAALQAELRKAKE